MGLAITPWDTCRNTVGSIHAASMNDKMTKNEMVDIRANIRGKRATRPLEDYQEIIF